MIDGCGARRSRTATAVQRFGVKRIWRGFHGEGGQTHCTMARSGTTDADCSGPRRPNRRSHCRALEAGAGCSAQRRGVGRRSHSSGNDGSVQQLEKLAMMNKKELHEEWQIWARRQEGKARACAHGISIGFERSAFTYRLLLWRGRRESVLIKRLITEQRGGGGNPRWHCQFPPRCTSTDSESDMSNIMSSPPRTSHCVESSRLYYIPEEACTLHQALSWT